MVDQKLVATAPGSEDCGLAERGGWPSFGLVLTGAEQDVLALVIANHEPQSLANLMIGGFLAGAYIDEVEQGLSAAETMSKVSESAVGGSVGDDTRGMEPLSKAVKM
ncbi:hypothetical protein CBS470a_009997 [Colletotrichum nupharicola]|nr:hypothetical protein CBS470a_009997 [Colletotrichum nupharicola]